MRERKQLGMRTGGSGGAIHRDLKKWRSSRFRKRDRFIWGHAVYEVPVRHQNR
jgi:hypothetical protein